jgi:lipoyl(octanoyl) transferase
MEEYQYWGEIGYAAAWDQQKALFNARLEAKKGKNDLPDVFVFCEHPSVYTLGKSGLEENLLVGNQLLKAKGVEFFHTDRGGDITYHGPGQIVCYPILDLEHYGIGLRQYLHFLEEAVILFLEEFGVKGERLDGATGVWIDPQVPGRARKICAMGVRSSRFVTMHGLALNINTDLSFYEMINPCGFTDKGVTSLMHETNQVQDMEKCREILYSKMVQLFHPVVELGPTKRIGST